MCRPLLDGEAFGAFVSVYGERLPAAVRAILDREERLVGELAADQTGGMLDPDVIWAAAAHDAGLCGRPEARPAFAVDRDNRVYLPPVVAAARDEAVARGGGEWLPGRDLVLVRRYADPGAPTSRAQRVALGGAAVRRGAARVSRGGAVAAL